MVPLSVCNALKWSREAHHKAAELRLRKMTTGEDMIAVQIRDLVERMHGNVAILTSASTEDRRGST